MIGSLGWQELLIILVILALLFGANRVAGLGGALGRGIREFRSEARNDSNTTEEEPPQETASSNTSSGAAPAETSEEKSNSSSNPPSS